MNKKIEFKYGDEDYTLEYNRDAVIFMESQGFDLRQIQTRSVTMLDILWKGAFYKNHRKVKIDKIEEIYRNISNKEDLHAGLIEMLNETYVSLLADNDDVEDNSKNIEWKMS